MDPYVRRELDAFNAALADLGYVGPWTIDTTFPRFDDGRQSELRPLAADLVDSGSDIIVAVGSRAALAVKALGAKIPVVFIAVGDPVGIGLAQGLARPGGTFTGFSDQSTELTPKQLQLLCEAFPAVRRVGVVWQPESPSSEAAAQRAVDAGRGLGVDVARFKLADGNSAFGTLESARIWGVDALLLLGSGYFRGAFHRRYTVPTMVDQPEFVPVYATMSYAANRVDLHRRAADYVDRILRGASPASLPIQQPTTFDFVINNGLARALGFTIPHSVLMQATEIIP
jgi:putative ABC transport system substrate-binding protein